MNSFLSKIFFNKTKIQAFGITRLHVNEIEEKVYLQVNDVVVDITATNSMICLDPFCMAAWLPANTCFDARIANILFKKEEKTKAVIKVSLIEKLPLQHGVLLLLKIEGVKNHHLSAMHRQVLFRYFLRSTKNTYYSRKVISALYSYPRSVIIVSYKDAEYCNVFPMDIHGYVKEENIYILGLRTTNITLDKILAAKKVVVCDTDEVPVNIVYDLGKHSSKAPTTLDDLPFKTSESELFKFPVPDFVGNYKEIEIIANKKMGYHMLMIGKVINQKQVKNDPASLYHVGFLQFQKSKYKSIDGLF